MIPVPPSAFLDANILFSKTLRDWICLMSLDSGEVCYRVRWSDDVLAEWVYRMRRKRPEASDAAIGNHRRQLEEAFPNAMVTGYDPSKYPQPADIHDWHALAAAAHAQVDFLVTDDRKAFPDECVQDRFEVHTADEFLTLMGLRHPDIVRTRLGRQISYWSGRTPGADAGLIVQKLRKASVPHFAEIVARCAD